MRDRGKYGGGGIRNKGKWEPPVAKLLGNQGRYTGYTL